MGGLGMTRILTAAVFAAVAASVLGMAQAHAEPVDPGSVCTGFDLGQSPQQVYDGMHSNDHRITGPQQTWDVYGPIWSGECDRP